MEYTEGAEEEKGEKGIERPQKEEGISSIVTA